MTCHVKRTDSIGRIFVRPHRQEKAGKITQWMPAWAAFLAAVSMLTLGAHVSSSWAQDEFSEVFAIIEINASDGDAGFHVLFDGDAWQWVTVRDPSGRLLLQEKATGPLREQGVTENFFESAEPPCFFDEEDPEADPDEVVTLGEFLERFEKGDYQFAGKKLERGYLTGEANFTHDIPAAPDISETDESILNPNNAVIKWAGGDDLGECDDPMLVVDGIIPDPGTVEVVRWEVVVEPDVEPLPEGVVKSVFSIQVPGNQTSVTVPPEYLNAYSAVGVTEFKFEVGAKEASGNQTFTEGTFELTPPVRQTY